MDNSNLLKYCDKCLDIGPSLDTYDELYEVDNQYYPQHCDCGGDICTVSLSHNFPHAITVEQYNTLSPGEQIQAITLIRQDIYAYKAKIDQIMIDSAKNTAKIIAESKWYAEMRSPNYVPIICPVCGQYETERISTASRMFSTTLFGLGSSSVGKEYVCKNCGHKW